MNHSSRISGGWDAAIGAYITGLTAAGSPVASRKLRAIQLRRMARELEVPLADVTKPMLLEWFGRHDEWELETRRSNRAAARGFLDWAHQNELIATNLKNTLPRVRQPIAAAQASIG